MSGNDAGTGLPGRVMRRARERPEIVAGGKTGEDDGHRGERHPRKEPALGNGSRLFSDREHRGLADIETNGPAGRPRVG